MRVFDALGAKLSAASQSLRRALRLGKTALLDAGVAHALLGEAGLRRAVQLLRGGLIFAALLGEARQSGAVEALAGRLNGAAVVGHRRGDEPTRGEQNCDRFHFSLPRL